MQALEQGSHRGDNTSRHMGTPGPDRITSGVTPCAAQQLPRGREPREPLSVAGRRSACQAHGAALHSQHRGSSISRSPLSPPTINQEGWGEGSSSLELPRWICRINTCERNN